MSNNFDSTAVAFRYARHMAISEGLLVDASQGDFAEVSREHFPHRQLAMTIAVFALLERAVVETGEGADFAGVWHDILWTSRECPVRPLPGGHTFEVSFLTSGARRWIELKILFHCGDHGEPCATVLLPDED